MDDDDEVKIRTVEYQGETLEFACTDEELEFFLKPESLDVMWWRKQHRDNPTFSEDWADRFVDCNSDEEIEALRQEMYSHFRAKRNRLIGH